MTCMTNVKPQDSALQLTERSSKEYANKCTSNAKLAEQIL